MSTLLLVLIAVVPVAFAYGRLQAWRERRAGSWRRSRD